MGGANRAGRGRTKCDVCCPPQMMDGRDVKATGATALSCKLLAKPLAVVTQFGYRNFLGRLR